MNNPSGNSAACETSAVKGKSVLPEKKKKSKKRIILTIAFVIMNVIVVGYTAIVEFTKERPAGKVGINFGIINIICLICAFLCLGVVLGVETVKYLLMMRSLGEKVSLRHAFQVSALGKYYDSITPTGAGGQPFQIWYMHSNGYLFRDFLRCSSVLYSLRLWSLFSTTPPCRRVLLKYRPMSGYCFIL